VLASSPLLPEDLAQPAPRDSYHPSGSPRPKAGKIAASYEEETEETEEGYAKAVGFMEEFGDKEADNEEEAMACIRAGLEGCKLALWMLSDVMEYRD